MAEAAAPAEPEAVVEEAPADVAEIPAEPEAVVEEAPVAEGMRELLDWLRTQEATDSVESAAAELERRGLTR